MRKTLLVIGLAIVMIFGISAIAHAGGYNPGDPGYIPPVYKAPQELVNYMAPYGAYQIDRQNFVTYLEDGCGGYTVVTLSRTSYVLHRDKTFTKGPVVNLTLDAKGNVVKADVYLSPGYDFFSRWNRARFRGALG